jgi:hypothetical protein
MKKIILAMMLVVPAGCDRNYDLGTSSLGLGSVEVEVRGNTFFITIDGEKKTIFLEPVSVVSGWEKIDLNDTVNLVPSKIYFSRIKTKITKVDSEIVEHSRYYAIAKGTFEIIFVDEEICIPVRFSRSLVLLMCDGEPEEVKYTFSFKVTGHYLKTDGLVTNEETHSRSYYDCMIEVFDNTEKIGEIKTTISFFTKNEEISFSASVQETEEEYVYY